MLGALRILAFALALAFALPGASAFATTQEELYLAYDATRPPALLATGAISMEGALSGAFILAGATTTRLADIPHLTILDRTSAAGDADLRDATIEVHSGGLLWSIPSGVTMPISLAAGYGLGLGLPDAPVPSQDGSDPGAGFLLAGESVEGVVSWSRGVGELLPYDATITIRDARGTPLPGWDLRTVNPNMRSQSDPDAAPIVFHVEGAFQARLGGALMGGATGTPGSVSLEVGPAGEDRLSATLSALETSTADFFGDESPFSQVGGPLDTLAQVSGILNGALLVMPGGVGESVDAIRPLEARFGAETFDPGAITILRGDMAVAWKEGQMQVSGEPTVALGRNGFEIDEPVTVWIFPFVSLVLWAFAAGAIVYFFMKRPPQGAPNFGLRLLSFAFSLCMLVAVFYIWDRSFEQTFGTGVFSTIREKGISPETLPTLGTLLGFELIPWGIAALLFALPVRIAVGVALRYLGKGKSFKGLANGAGLIALGILGPIYALWCFNLIWSRVASSMGT